MSFDTSPTIRWVIAAGGLLAALGGSGVILFFFQPWRQCEYEDTSAGCVMLPHDAAAMAAFATVSVVGATALMAGLMSRRPTS